jgi:O-succinylbenzoic acid--CoA ligase
VTTVLRPLPIPSGPAAAAVVEQLWAVVGSATGTGTAFAPMPADDAREIARLSAALRPGEPIADEVAVVVATSGTTGVPKGAMLSAAALRASATATHRRLGGPGRWLLALPPHHIAGVQVLLRSLAAGHPPAVLDVSHGFDPDRFAAAADAMGGPRRYTSLVPTQLIKALDHRGATAALAALDGVLIGGAATPAAVTERAAGAGITVLRTYGMSETCGGCVYNGVPLDGVRTDIAPDGRIRLGGDTLALGYRGLPDHPAFADPGWFRTDDAGLIEDGVLRVLGRLDEAISTGGLTVVPQVVEAVLAGHPAVRECAVYGVPDERLGERVVAAVVPAGAAPALAELRDYVADRLDHTAAPRELRILTDLPLRGPGKVDRAALRRG